MAQANLFRTMSFSLSWWAFSFPLAAVAVAVTRHGHMTARPFARGLAWALFGALVGVILVLTNRTLVAIFQKKICVPEE